MGTRRAHAAVRPGFRPSASGGTQQHCCNHHEGLQVCWGLQPFHMQVLYVMRDELHIEFSRPFVF
jgi:hypothetical protein